MAEIHWTPKMVAESLEEAADTLRRLPPVTVRGFVSAWPPVVHDFWDAFGWEEVSVRLGPPSARAIDEMDMALGWLRWLKSDDARLVWQRATGRPWKYIARDFGMDRSTAWRHWTGALMTIQTRLNKLKRHKQLRNTGKCDTGPGNMVEIWS